MLNYSSEDVAAGLSLLGRELDEFDALDTRDDFT